MRIAASLIVALSLAACATVAPKPVAQDESANATDTAGVLVIEVNEQPQLIVFVATDGKTAEVSYDACLQDATCAALFAAELKADKVQGVDLKGDAPSTSGTAL